MHTFHLLPCFTIAVALQVLVSIFSKFKRSKNVQIGSTVAIRSKPVYYHDGDVNLTGYMAFPDVITNAVPGVIIAHDWNGRDDFENGRADALAQLGYVAFAYDIYGTVGESRDHNIQLMAPFNANRSFLLHRVRLALNQFHLSAPRGALDGGLLAIIGYCFGGRAVLDAARANLPGIRAAITFHGSLDAPPNAGEETIEAKLLILHGHADKQISPQMVVDFANEAESRHADYQVIIYGNGTDHAFTVPGPRYHAVSARRAWTAMINTLRTAFSGEDFQNTVVIKVA